VFLQQLAESDIIPTLPTEPTIDEAPEPGADDTLLWPADPLGERRGVVEAAAAAVTEAIERGVELAPEHLVSSIDQLVEEEKTRLAPVRASWPVRIPASQFDRWIDEPEQMLQARVQPRPPTTGLAQQRGTQFHAWVESYFQGFHAGLLGDVDIDGDEADLVDQDVEAWKRAFESSEFAGLTPVALEREIHLPLAGHLIICKIDAVFDRSGRIQIVDWKTGQQPSDSGEVQRKALQLALYRLAWAEWSGRSLDEVDAVFWYSAADAVVDPGELPGREELEALVEQAKAASV
jgi:DNA helicase-2/ATP-dependent DNA helicase PcrA